MEIIAGSWYALRVKTGYEVRVAEQIDRFHQATGFKEKIIDICDGAKRIVQLTEKGRKRSDEPMYPGYIFVKVESMTKSMWNFLRNVPGVCKVLDALPVNEEEIEQVYQICKGEVEIQVPSNESPCIDENSNDVKLEENSSSSQSLINVEALLRFLKKGTRHLIRIPTFVYRTLIEKNPFLKNIERKGTLLIQKIIKLLQRGDEFSGTSKLISIPINQNASFSNQSVAGG